MINYIPAEEHENVKTYQREDERDINIYEDIQLVGELYIKKDLHNASSVETLKSRALHTLRPDQFYVLLCLAKFLPMLFNGCGIILVVDEMDACGSGQSRMAA